jgi:branched-chain amino acid transport system permease protein
MATMQQVVAADESSGVPTREPLVRRLGPLVGMSVVAAFALAWGLGGGADRYEIFVATQFLAFVTAAAGLNILYGYSGLVSLGHGAFFAIGAYGMGWGLLNTGLSFPVLLLLVLLATVAIGLVLVLPTLRVQGHFLAMVTVAYASVGHVVLVNWDSVTGGPLGLSISPRRLETWVPAEEVLFGFAVVVAVLSLLFMAVVRTSSVGRAWRSIRQSEVSAACLAVPVRRYRVLAFVVSAVLAALGGVIYGLNVGFLTPSEYDVMLSINLLIAVIVGGSGRFLGPVLGSAIVVIGPEFFRFLGDHRELMLGLILIAVLSFGRGGVAGLLDTVGRAISRAVAAARNKTGVSASDERTVK